VHEQEIQAHIEVILRHAELLESTKIEPTEPVEAPGQHLDTIVPLELINIIGVHRQEPVRTEVVQQAPEVQHTEVQVAVPEVEAHIEALEVALEALNRIEVQHLEIAVIGLVVEAPGPEAVEVTEVRAVVPEARVEV